MSSSRREGDRRLVAVGGLPCVIHRYTAGGSGAGGGETAPIKQSLHMIYALVDGTLYLQCHNCLPVGRYVEIIKHLQRRYKKVGIIIDNASTIICIAMRKCLDYLDGDMETSHLPLHLQQLNPIKTEWGRIKAAIANTPFGDLDKMQYAIRQMIHN